MQSNMRNLIHYPQTNDALLAQTLLVLSLTKLNKIKENKLIDADRFIKACLSLNRVTQREYRSLTLTRFLSGHASLILSLQHNDCRQ